MAKDSKKKKKKERNPAEPDSAMTDGAVAGDVAPLEERVAELEAELEKSRAETAEAADRALRTLAEFDNFRKRTARERQDAQGAGAAAVLLDLLATADDFERALANVPDDAPEAFVEGVRMVARGVDEMLERHGVTRLVTEGEAFDPEIHEALSSVPTEDAEPNTVMQEIQAGYRRGDRILRPAKVIVAKAPEA
ncbi:MAG: nucleotide exchange factor GrpE [Gemmatimonadetes bacterium]|nr:nucleotide exchange factor GrpE [Gemmatimonadota bacterium]